MRLVIVGIEGLSPADLEEGRLPDALGALREEGVAGPLAGVVPPWPGPSWQALGRGAAPGRGPAPLWERVAEEGGLAVLIDVPGAGTRALGRGADRVDLPAARTGDDPTAASRARLAAARGALAEPGCDLLVLVDDGLARLRARPDARGAAEHLDAVARELGSLLEAIDGELAVCVVSTFAASAPRGGFRPGAFLGERPFTVEAAGSFAGFRVRPGTPDAAAARAALAAELEALRSADGAPLGARVLRSAQPGDTLPEVVLDLSGAGLVCLPGAAGPAFAGPEDAALDGRCATRAEGVLLLASSRLPSTGTVEGATLLDVAPTLLLLTGRPAEGAEGRSLLEQAGSAGPSAEEEELMREHLRGLGYL